MKTGEIIDRYTDVCDEILEKINNKYFEGEAITDWVGDERGGVATVSDYFFNMSDMVYAIENYVSEDDFFGYYDYCVDEKEPKVNFRNYLKLKKDEKEKV